MLTGLAIQGREILLNKILGINSTEVLNTPAVDIPAAAGYVSPAEELKRTLNQIKAEAITSDGREVDYKAILQSQTYSQYRSLTSELANFDYLVLKAPDEQMAFWINLYNALVIDAVIQAEVQKSVTESWLGILGFFQKAAYLINGQRFSLTDIEHAVLRANRGFPYFPGPHFAANDPRLGAVLDGLDPRIHFALNCASRSCPPIGVYHPNRIQQQLELAARSFINGDSEVDYDRKTISISRIFRWYVEDFGGERGVADFLFRYLELPEKGIPARGQIREFRLNYHPYDWSLNKTFLG